MSGGDGSPGKLGGLGIPGNATDGIVNERDGNPGGLIPGMSRLGNPGRLGGLGILGNPMLGIVNEREGGDGILHLLTSSPTK